MNEPRAVLRTEAAVEYRKMFGLQMRSAFNRAGRIDMRDNLLNLLRRVSKLDQGRWNRLIYDLDDAAANQLFILHQCEIGLYAGCVAIHHESDGPGRSNHGCLRVSVPADL